MKRLIAPITVLLLLTACSGMFGVGGGQSSSSLAASSSSVATADIIVDSPASNGTVQSPLTITGRAKGTWYFEATFPIRLLDDLGNEIAVGHADAQGDWMTEDYVPFTATLPFTTAAKNGTLVLHKDNPSGLLENDASVSVPVRFQ
ncbi:hypothetical protein EXS70_03155 [Candidatus Peribacteria bacterium]|nr:hypothetical protein [Candidatus Peribacteria bacterium]